MGGRGDLSVSVQALALRHLFPDSAIHLRPRYLRWHGSVQPTPLSDRYHLRLEYHEGSSPRVCVESPELVTDADGLLPHVWDTGHLCVHQFGDWHARMLLTQTFLPWAAEWLLYYELWRSTGLWHGDGSQSLDAVSQRRILHPYV